MDKESIFKKLKFGSPGEKLVMNAPEEYLAILTDLDFDTEPDASKIGKYDFVQVFGSSQVEMETIVKCVAHVGKYDCLFWACYPKSKGKERYDLNRDTVWLALGLAGLRPVSQIAINDKWSALRGRNPELVGK
jgi:hypothetical protein